MRLVVLYFHEIYCETFSKSFEIFLISIINEISPWVSDDDMVFQFSISINFYFYLNIF